MLILVGFQLDSSIWMLDVSPIPGVPRVLTIKLRKLKLGSRTRASGSRIRLMYELEVFGGAGRVTGCGGGDPRIPPPATR